VDVVIGQLLRDRTPILGQARAQIKAGSMISSYDHIIFHTMT
jgi:hypothetical protein